jgi:two-component system chemotaxis sensor kinase CheA
LLQACGDIVDATPHIRPDGSIEFHFLVRGDLTSLTEEQLGVAGLQVTRASETIAPTAPAASRPASVLAPSHFVRVDLGRLDDLMRMIGDLVIGRARLGESLAHVEQQVSATAWRAIQENSLTLERQLRDLREGVMRVRLVPVGEVFRRMPFVVRDLAKDMRKTVELEMHGEETELDKFLVERLLDPLVHLVRNAIAHGIETPDERRRAGKPEAGRITLSASTVGDLVMIEVADDGRGVDTAQVLQRAQSLGFPLPADPEQPEALLSILCAPGFSTRESADRASGRGVGMSVVKTTIEELGGRLTLDSAPGQGTRFIVELPVTLAITDAIVAHVGGQLFAVPQGAVREIIEIDPQTVRAVEQQDIVPHRGCALPLVHLSSVFRLPSAPARHLYAFVIGQGTSAVGLVVDRIVGQREIVVRPLTDPLVKVHGVVGATDLGDGRVVLILDPARLSRSFAGSRT